MWLYIPKSQLPKDAPVHKDLDSLLKSSLVQARPYLVEDDFYRHAQLRKWGALPFPMPYVRTPEMIGFQRWVVRRYDKVVTWDAFKQHNYRPEGM